MRSTEHIDQPATSVWIETGKRLNVDEGLGNLLSYLSVRLDEWAQGGFSAIRKNWEAKVENIQKAITVRDGGGIRTGVLAGFGEDGELLLRNEVGVVTSVWAGDVFV